MRLLGRYLPLLGVGLALGLCAGSAGAARVMGIRHWTAPDHTRIVVDLSSPASHEVFTPTDPDRIAVNVQSSTFASGVQRFEIGDGLVHRVRINQLSGPRAQVVLDLVGPLRHRVFALDAYGSKPNRIVIDVFRPEEGDPDDRVQVPVNGTPVVVIDPGHGGGDPGAVGVNGLREKDVTLRFARKLEKTLERSGIQVHLTRTGDYFVSLRDRYRVAERQGADLFVSLHANASKSRNARGAEVFFLTLGRATDTESRRVAELENASDLVGGAPPESEDDLVSILADLQMKNTLARSSLVAASVLETLGERELTRTRSVKQARFMVLRSARVPSILVEIGFITNSKDAQLMQGELSDRFAAALAEGVATYLERVH